MTLASLLKWLRERLPREVSEAANKQSPADPVAISKDDEDIDPFNPFPEPVVLEFRDVLDLHSIPPKQVRAVVEEYLEEAYQRGTPFVRIIHGKGIGVQRDIVRSILSRTSYVQEFKDAPPEAGGWGATIVTLRNK
jgi:dsDNA-specific endonuclease/ATPase MutS2